MKKSPIKMLESHTGLVLVSGAVLLKVGVVTGSLFFLVGGYGAFVFVIDRKIRKWRNGK